MLFRILCLLFLVNSSLLQAQSLDLSGVVKESNSGQVLPGVNIIHSGTNQGTVTNADGLFSIQLNGKNPIIEVSFLGFKTQTIVVDNQTDLIINLVEDATQMDEIVITALGLERSTKDLGYAIQSLDSRDITEVKSINFLDNLSGKLAGVNISQGATGVGSSSKITIRGEASFTNNNPLFVIDGTVINNNSIVNFTNDAAAGFQEVDFGNGAMDINSDDIESISVLKGPSAAALYGTRASNGVIIISTKKGNQFDGIGVEFNSSIFVNSAFQLPQFQNQYGQGNSGNFEFVDGLGGGTNDNITYSWGPELNQGIQISQFDSPVTLNSGQVVRGGDVAVHGGTNITPTDFNAYPNNLKNFYKTGYSLINQVAFNNHSDKGSYRISLSNLQDESIIPGVNYARNNISGSFEFRPTNGLKIQSNLQYINSQSDNRPSGGYGSENINYSLVAWGPRSLNTAALEDYWQPGLEGIQQYSFNYTFFDNPYFILNENKNGFNRDRIFGNITASFQLTPSLSARFRTSMDYSSENRTFKRAFSSNRFRNGAYAEHSLDFRETNTDLWLNYKPNLTSDFGFDISLGANRLDQIIDNKQSQTIALAQAGIFKLSNAAAPVEVFNYEGKKRINSIYSLLKLNYKSIVFLDITGRNDWSSALASPTNTANTSFFYPSVSSSLVLSNWVSLPSSISFLKLRASLAEVGNDTGPYQTTGAFIAQTAVNGLATFSDQNTIPNGNLKPEKTRSIEVGTDIRFFDDRLKLDLSYYQSTTENQIISLPISITSGYEQQVVNGGQVVNKGIDIFANIDIIRKANLNWNSGFNFSKNVAKVTDLPDEVDRLTLAYSRVYDNVNQTVWYQVDEGGRIGDMYGTGYAKNENGQFIIDANGQYIVDNDLKLLGNYNPDFTLGWNNQIAYKKWNLSFLLDWRQGGIIVSRTLSLAAVGGQLEETQDRPSSGIIAEGVFNAGTEENPVYQDNAVSVSAEQYYRQFYDRNHEENNVYNASYLKLRQFSLGYTFDSSSCNWLHNESKIRLSLIGRNIFALSEIPHFDPEQLAVQGQQFVSGVEDMSYATSRSIGFKLGFTF